MRHKRKVMVAALGALAALAAPAAVASAEESAQDVINRYQNEGYTVNIDKVGTAPLDQCVVTSVRNPQQVNQYLPYVGPGADEPVLVLTPVSRSISVSLNCSR